MHIKQVQGQQTLAESTRRHLESATYSDKAAARLDVQRAYPYHLVSEATGSIQVEVRDRSFAVAEFKEVL